MKKTLLVIALLATSYLLFGSFDFFPENPCNIADRSYSHIDFPGLTYELNIDNTLLQLDDINMFQEGHRLTDAEKATLSKDDFDVNFNYKATLLDFGHKNWNFALKSMAFANVEILDNTYTKLVVYGNDTNIPYSSHTGEGSEAFSFWKATFNYAYPHGLNLGMIPGLFPADSTSAFGEYLRDMTLYFGANINFNYSMLYASIDESIQNFGSMPEKLYYYYNAHFKYTDEHSVGRLTPSLGFGMKARIFEGYWHASIDDLFMQLNYKNLGGGWYERKYRNDLLYFEEGYKAFYETILEDDSTRVKNRYVKIKPSVSVGMEYTFFQKLNVMAKYINEQYSYKNGFSFGVDYQLACVPMQAVMGYDENIFYEFKTGLIFNGFEWMLGGTFYHGFFRYGKGIGINSMIRFKF
jgi:hypothetical protein